MSPAGTIFWSGLANHCHLDVTQDFLAQFVKGAAGKAGANGNLAHVKARGLGREFRLHHARHEVDAEDRANDAEGVGDRIADGRVLALRDVKCGLECRGARHRSRVKTECMADLDAEDLPEPERHAKAGEAGDEGEKIVFLARADDALEELPAIKDADAIEEHDQAGEPDRTDDLGFRRECTDGKADKEHGTDPEGEAEDIDLADQIADADGEKCRQDRLASDDVARKIQHFSLQFDSGLVSGHCSPHRETGR